MSCEEYRKEIAKALERIMDEKIIRRIYISTLVTTSMKEGDNPVSED